MRKLAVAGIFFVICIVFMLISCDNSATDTPATNPLVGTWEDTFDNAGEPCFDRFIFTDNEITRICLMYYDASINFDHVKYVADETEHGTYQYTDSVITAIWESGIIRQGPAESPKELPLKFPVETNWSYSIKRDELTITLREGVICTYKKIN